VSRDGIEILQTAARHSMRFTPFTDEESRCTFVILTDAAGWPSGSNVIRRDGLEQPRGNPDLVCIRARIGDSAEKFQELGRTNDGEGDASAVQRIRRALSEGCRRPASGRERPRGQILRRPSRATLARAVGRGAPRPIGFDEWLRRSQAAA
jgi:hypothetical protein